MTIINSLWDFITGTNKDGANATPSVTPYDYNNLYEALYALYNNDDAIVPDDTTRRLRTVVNRSVEFYAAKMIPGQEIKVMTGEDEETQNTELQDAIQQVIKDSNLANNKAPMIRGFSLYGDSFIRVRGDKEKTYLEDLSVFYVTDFSEDSRGFLTYLRIDIPILDDNDLPANYTEYWDLDTQTFQSWQGQTNRTTPIKEMGSPKEVMLFSELGIDFIPVVHTKFRDNGDPRGQGCVYHALDKVYEANRVATRLHDLLFAFGEPVFIASANSTDAQGRPLPPPRVDSSAGNSPVPSSPTIGGVLGQIFGRLISLPGLSTITSLIPPIDYADALAILNAQMEELEKDLPELRWYALSPTEQSAMSGAALRTLLGAAVDRANEARNNFLASLSRAFEMALTIGIYNGVFPASLGTFDSGDFDHELQVDSAWGESVSDKADIMAKLTGGGMPAKAAMRLAGFTEAQVEEAFPAGTGIGESSNTPPTVTTMPATKGGVIKGTPPKAGAAVVRVA
jgi:hypothetical protein